MSASTNPIQFHYLFEDCAAADALSQAFDLTTEGNGGVIILSGELGIGKGLVCSRFLNQVADRADCQPAHIFRSRFSCQSPSLPYSLWLDLRRTHQSRRELFQNPYEDELTGAQNSPEMVRQLASGVLDFTREEPVILMCDDFQWADSASMNLLEHIASQSNQASILLILTVHTSALNDGTVGAAVSRLLANQQTVMIEMTPVARETVRRELAAQFAGLDEARLSQLSAALHRLSDGNRFYLVQLFRHLSRAAGSGEQTFENALRQLPQSILQLPRHDLARLSPAALETLQLAAILDDEIQFDLLAEIANLSPNELLARLEEALNLGLLVEDERSRVRFGHGIVRESILSQLSSLRKRVIHRDILAILATQEHAPPDLVAEHALGAGDLTLARDKLHEAALQSMSVFEPVEAERFYRRAVAIAAEICANDPIRAVLHLELAQCLMNKDHEEALHEAEHAGRLAMLVHDTTILLKSKLYRAQLLYNAGDIRGTMVLLDEMFETLDCHDDDVIRVEALAYRGYCEATLCRFDDLLATTTELVDLERFTKR